MAEVQAPYELSPDADGPLKLEHAAFLWWACDARVAISDGSYQFDPGGRYLRRTTPARSAC